MTIRFVGLPTRDVEAIRNHRRDAYGEPVEQRIADGDAWPCRHCLRETQAGQGYLILAHRPFRSRNPYAETGPIFLCAEECAARPASSDIPPILRSANYLVRGYSKDERIVYGSGKVTPTGKIAAYAQELLNHPDIAFVDVRSASNNCFQCRIHPSDQSV